MSSHVMQWSVFVRQLIVKTVYKIIFELAFIGTIDYRVLVLGYFVKAVLYSI